MATQAVRTARTASPERWARAVTRAVAEGVQVRQINASGAWVATSGTQVNVAYLLEIVGGVVRSCSCPAGEFGDPCCKHAAAYYLATGMLDPEPPGQAAGAACPECGNVGFVRMQTGGRLSDWWAIPCPTCRPKRWDAA